MPSRPRPRRPTERSDSSPLATVVGAVVTDRGRVLAARRTTPPVGRWEFPGGKVEPGETVAEALVREVREELGCTVRVGDGFTDDGSAWPISTTLELRLFHAEVVDGAARPGDSHDEVRWLRLADLADVDWLPSDRRAVDLLLRSPGPTGRGGPRPDPRGRP